MIQRIQTLYLLIVCVLSTVTFFMPLITFTNPELLQTYILNYKGVLLFESGEYVFQKDAWPLTLLSAIIPLVTLISIFCFKKRILQLRLSFFNMVLMAGWYALLLIYLWFTKIELKAAWNLSIVTVFPVINIILTFLAIRAIGRDEALIKSLNRIR